MIEQEEGSSGQVETDTVHIESPVADEPVVIADDTEAPVQTESNARSEMEIARMFAQRYGEMFFGPERNNGEENNAARGVLSESLATQLLYTFAQRELVKIGEEKPFEMVAEPAKRFQALRGAEETAKHIQAVYREWRLIEGRGNFHGNQSEYYDRFLKPYIGELQDLDFVQSLVGRGTLSTEGFVRSHTGLLNQRFGIIPDRDKPFFARHLNAINMVEMARDEDSKATGEGKRGRLFGTDQDDWMRNFLKFNRYVEQDGVFAPSDMDPEAQQEYFGAFETYRQLFEETNTSERGRFNSEEAQAIEHLEGLVAKYEAIEVGGAELQNLGYREANAREILNLYKESLPDKESDKDKAQEDLDNANFLNHNSRQGKLYKALTSLDILKGQIDEAEKDLGRAEKALREAQDAPKKLTEIGSEFQRHGIPADKESAKAKIAERKKQPGY